jgi:hypothetical protein
MQHTKSKTHLYGSQRQAFLKDLGVDLPVYDAYHGQDNDGLYEDDQEESELWTSLSPKKNRVSFLAAGLDEEHTELPLKAERQLCSGGLALRWGISLGETPSSSDGLTSADVGCASSYCSLKDGGLYGCASGNAGAAPAGGLGLLMTYGREDEREEGPSESNKVKEIKELAIYNIPLLTIMPPKGTRAARKPPPKSKPASSASKAENSAGEQIGAHSWRRRLGTLTSG